jgi:quercetin dioxygenase-like cupin family protein
MTIGTPQEEVMFRRNKSEAPIRKRDGLVSHILLQGEDVEGGKMAVTWVDLAAGASQQPHRHSPEQVYVIIRGEARMLVGEEEQEVGEGDLIHIPSNVDHGIRNLSDKPLTYISTSTPTFDIIAYYDTGKL